MAFFDVEDVFPFLTDISSKHHDIVREIDVVSTLHPQFRKEWKEWDVGRKPRKEEWTLFPFMGFGLWETNNCAMCPVLTDFLKTIPSLRLACLSRLKAHTDVIPHEGWRGYAHKMLRCHYGLKVQGDCKLIVADESRDHMNGKWIVFDDTKTHYAYNHSGSDRIVLIIDIERPEHLQEKKDDNGIEYTKELSNIIELYKNKEGVTRLF